MALLLCLFGADGSGKSTIARRFAQYLRAQGRYVVVTWVRGTHTAASVLARLLSFFSTFKGSCNPYYGICIPSKMRMTWIWIEFISILPVVFSRFVVPKLLRRVVIAERSLMDFLVWLVITLRWHGVVRSFVGRCVISLHSSLCDTSVYVRVDLNTLLSRRRGSREEQLIPIQLKIYDSIAKALKVPIIDTTDKPIEDNLRKISRILGVKNEWRCVLDGL